MKPDLVTRSFAFQLPFQRWHFILFFPRQLSDDMPNLWTIYSSYIHSLKVYIVYLLMDFLGVCDVQQARNNQILSFLRFFLIFTTPHCQPVWIPSLPSAHELISISPLILLHVPVNFVYFVYSVYILFILFILFILLLLWFSFSLISPPLTVSSWSPGAQRLADGFLLPFSFFPVPSLYSLLFRACFIIPLNTVYTAESFHSPQFFNACI